MGLSHKQKIFTDEYIKSGNGSKSAIFAGYSQNTAYAQASKLLKMPKIKEYIDVKNKEIDSNNIADLKELFKFWTEIIRDENQNMKNRLKASEMRGKSLGAFIDKLEATTDSTININVNIEDEKQNV